MDWDVSPPLTPRQADASEITPVESTVTAVGDLIRLGQGAPQDFRGSPAVVTRIAATHCTVAVLDRSQRRAIGECWPNHCDCVVVSTSGRLGARVVIDGFQKGRGKSLNGSVGTIVTHRKEGHPCFVRKASAVGDERVASPVLVCCVELDVPVGTKEKQVLVEPLFLARLPDASEVAIALAAAASLAGSNDVEKRLPTPCGLSSPPPPLPLPLPPSLPAPGPSLRAVTTKSKISFPQAPYNEPTLGSQWLKPPVERRGSDSETPSEKCNPHLRRARLGSKNPSDKCNSEARKKAPAQSFADVVFFWAWLSPVASSGEGLRPQPPAERPISWRELLCSSGGPEGESDAESDDSEPLPALHCASCCATSRKKNKARKFPDAPVASFSFFDTRTRSYTDCSTAYSPSSSFSPRSRLAPFSPRIEGLDAACEFHDALEEAADSDREREAHFGP